MIVPVFLSALGFFLGENSHTSLETGAPGSNGNGQLSIPVPGVMVCLSPCTSKCRRQCYINPAMTSGSRLGLEGPPYLHPSLHLLPFLVTCISFSGSFVFFCRQKKCSRFLAGEIFIQSRWNYSQTMTPWCEGKALFTHSMHSTAILCCTLPC